VCVRVYVCACACKPQSLLSDRSSLLRLSTLNVLASRVPKIDVIMETKAIQRKGKGMCVRVCGHEPFERSREVEREREREREIKSERVLMEEANKRTKQKPAYYSSINQFNCSELFEVIKTIRATRLRHMSGENETLVSDDYE